MAEHTFCDLIPLTGEKKSPPTMVRISLCSGGPNLIEIYKYSKMVKIDLVRAI
jgi:hypothetical protein